MILSNPVKIPRPSTSLCDILWYVFQGHQESRVGLMTKGACKEAVPMDPL